MMKTTEIYKPFTIVAVPFPFTDSPILRRRPAVVLSKPEYQEDNLHVTLLMVTSAKHSRWSSDHTIIDLKSSGLDAPSVVRQKIFTLDSSLIIKIVGKLAEVDQNQVLKRLKNHLLDL